MRITVNGKSPELKITCLADLKRALAIPGIVVKIIDMHPETRRRWKPERLEKAETGRRVAKVQTNGWMHDDKSWMYFGKAAEWKFPGNDTASWHDTHPNNDESYLTYKLIPSEEWDK